MIGAAGIFTISQCQVLSKNGDRRRSQNFILMYAVGANVSGQIASVIASGGLLLSFFIII